MRLDRRLIPATPMRLRMEEGAEEGAKVGVGGSVGLSGGGGDSGPGSVLEAEWKFVCPGVSTRAVSGSPKTLIKQLDTLNTFDASGR